MSETYIYFYKNEIRNIELTIRDQNESPFYPDYAESYIEDVNHNIIVENATRSVSSNKVRMLIDTDVTSDPKIYNVIWTINKNSISFKHKTILTVRKL